MIHVIEELRLNDFKECHCPRPKDLFARIGKRVIDTNYESSEEIVPMNMSKIDSIEYLEQYDRMMSNRECGGTEAESNGKNDPSHSNEDVS